jgi:transcriptional regulator of aromatic amino acid metabolism
MSRADRHVDPEVLRSLYESGYGARQIAKRLGVSRTTTQR